MEQYLVVHGLKITFVDTKGRCLVANRSFRPGEIILEQDPYSSVLDTESKSQRCDACFTCSTNLQRCSACKSVSYCCISCQKMEWKLHKSECQMMVKLNQEKQKLPPPSLRLIVRLTIKRSLQALNVFPRTPVDNFEIVEALPTHYSETEEERLVLYAQMSNLVKAIVTPLEVDLKETCELLCRIACNAHTVCDEEFRPVGTGLYPVISIINHSCAPNSVLLFDGKRAVVRAMQNIDKGTEVTVSYVELAGSTKTRQNALKEQYYFVCHCKRCMKSETTDGIVEDSILEGYKCANELCDGAVISEEDRRILRCVLCGLSHDGDKLKRLESAANKLWEEANSAVKSGNDAHARLMFEETEGVQKTLFHKNSVYLMRTRDALLKICMSLKDWLSALKYCRSTLPAYERSYSLKSPLVGLQYFTLGKLEWFLGDSIEGLNPVKSLTRAREILSVTHGSSSKLVQELASMIKEAKMEAVYKAQVGGSR